MDKSKIDRINELAKKQKSIGLSDDEKAEQKKLREEYIQEYRASLQSILDNTVIQYENGSKVPLKKNK